MCIRGGLEEGSRRVTRGTLPRNCRSREPGQLSDLAGRPCMFQRLGIGPPGTERERALDNWRINTPHFGHPVAATFLSPTVRWVVSGVFDSLRSPGILTLFYFFYFIF